MNSSARQQGGQSSRRAPRPKGKKVTGATNAGKVGKRTARRALPVTGGAMEFAPASQARRGKTGSPMFRNLKPNGDCQIAFREYIQDITASSGTPSVFGVTSLPINPGQAQTFPWLAQIAPRFESYRFRKLKFDYETEAPSSLGGSLVLAIDYDAADPAVVSKQQALSFRGSVRSAPWQPCCHTSLAEDLHKQKSSFVRPGVQPAGTDIRLYDVGNLQVVSQGVTTANAVCGELYVDYVVDLMTPVLESTGGIPSFQLTGAGGSISNANPLGAAPTFIAGSNGYAVNATSQLTLVNPGQYMLLSQTVATAPASAIKWTNVYGAATIADLVDNELSTTTGAITMQTVITTVPNTIIQGTGVGTVTASILWVTWASPAITFT